MARAVAVAEFTRDLAHLVRVGMPLDAALEFVGSQAPDPGLRDAAQDMAHAVRRGETLSGAVKAQGTRLPGMDTHLLGLGEQSECLPDILERLSDHLDATRRFQARAWEAMLYPIVSLLFCLGVAAFLHEYIFPTFVAVDLQATHPLFPIAVRVLEAGCVLALVFSVALALPVADRLRWRLPWFGSLWRHAGLACACRSLSLAMGAGASLPRALRMAAQAERNSYLRAALLRAADDADRGMPLSGALLGRPECFPPYLVEAVAAGEQAETLPDALRRAADFHGRMLESTMGLLVVLLEPAALILVGVFVALACVSFWYPFYHWVLSLP